MMIFNGSDFTRFLTSNRSEVLFILLLMALALRLPRLRKKGLFLYDEAAYYRDTLCVNQLFRFIASNFLELFSYKKKNEEEKIAFIMKFKDAVFYHYTYFKRWHLYLHMIFTRIVKQKDLALTIPPLILGVAAIPVVYLTTEAVFGAKCAFISASIIALSGLHILHSRSAEPETGSALCYLLAMLFSIYEKKYLAGGGGLFTAESLGTLAA
ncbi:MAG TPA: glycosyltransferase family 39 protein, partial [bacterium]|nr:glycosyltransferase family 39 protein [bacterium]